jgi:hypothetical protein
MGRPCCCETSRMCVALDCQTVSVAAVADGYEYEPPREVTFPIRPQDVSVGLFVAAILHNNSGVDRTGQICQQNDKDRMRLVRFCGPIRVSFRL